MIRMFSGNSAFNQDIGGWDVSKLTDMSYAFAFASTFDADIGAWDVPSDTIMTSAFYKSKKRFIEDCPSWAVGRAGDPC